MSVELFEPIKTQRASESIFPLRDNEPEYARLSDPQTREHNRYGKLIALTQLIEDAESLNINGVSEKGFNPNRNKQHAFHFTADNCIGCHACESACSEKNDLPPHLSFRSVGYVEGGSYPNYTRMNISMACNHCDDPVCLKGCPTRAYTKHAEYGAVIQDPDICFGCGYCTWVCPYNAPQLDPVKGQVEKCNMCVDRLEVGLKPACVAACLGNALDFGVVENTPQKREQIETHIPGFPDPQISQPNIRFQQTRTLPREMKRTDSTPVKYQRGNGEKTYQPVVDFKQGQSRHWNLARLSSRENPLVLFTLASQAAIGLYLVLLLGHSGALPSLQPLLTDTLHPWGLLSSAALISLGLLLSASHLGKPLRAYRGFNNLRHSPMAREGACAALFMVFCGLQWIFLLPAFPLLQQTWPVLASLATASNVLAAWLSVPATAAAAGTIYYMYRCYRIKARPFWDHWQTATSFIGNCLSLGGILAGVLALLASSLANIETGPMLTTLSVLICAGIVLEGLGLLAHARDMKGAASEGAVSHYVQLSTFGKTYRMRNLALAALAFIFAGLSLPAANEAAAAVVWSLAALALMGIALVGRALFYVLVVPTTMPGAFFWKNKGFEEHARDIGLAANPQVGVALEVH